jgi:cyclic pyranopterin phosphate synthase
MPASGIDYVAHNELLTYEEILRIVTVVASQGVEKIRITGGEPFLRKDMPHLIKEISNVKGINKLAITTNATLCKDYVDELIPVGLTDWNISIDSLNKERFNTITRRDSYDTVIDCIRHLMGRPEVKLKLNTVVMKEHNIEDLIPLVEMTKENKLNVRFIEEMPFNGSGNEQATLEWSQKKILAHIKTAHPNIVKLQDPKNSTSLNYQVAGFKGSFGIIPAFTRSFCGTCNRLRLTPTGTIKTCLYDKGIFNIKNMIRSGASDQDLVLAIKEAIRFKAVDGFEADRIRRSSNSNLTSMAQIGG